MKDETGIPGKPFMGAKGPRSSRPRKAGEKTKEAKAVVTELFSDDRQEADHEQPPLAGRRKKGPRKKVQLGQNWSRAFERMEREGITMTEFVATLTPEELAKGQLRNPDGSFRGAPSKWVPQEFYKECIRELMRRGKEMYQTSYLEAVQTMLTIANNPIVEPKDRIKAATFVIERIEGKVPERLEVGVSEPWQEILTGIVASVDPALVPTRGFSEAGAREIEQ